LDLTPSDPIPKMHLVAGTVVLAVVTTLCVMPFDCMKTRMQQAGDFSMSIRSALAQVYRQAGVRGFFVGWRLRYLMYLVNAIMTTTILDKLEVQFHRLKSNS